jgi:hypothetical protein
MAKSASGKGQKKAAAPAKPKKETKKRLPRSVRKHVRRTKAALRREHGEAEAEKAIEQLVSRLRK